jgi:hypothetical protein
VHLWIGYAVHDAKDLTGRQMKIAMNFGCVVLERILQRLPVHRNVPEGSRRMTGVSHFTFLPSKASACAWTKRASWAEDAARWAEK